MKNLLFILCSLFYSAGLLAQAAAFDWAISFGSTTHEEPRQFCVDGEGNTYNTGTFSNLADFDPSAGVFVLTPVGEKDIYVNKFNESGELDWCFSIGNEINEEAFAIHYDNAGFIYVCGHFSGIVDFDPGIDIYELSSIDGSKSFILKLDTDGNFVWAKAFGKNGSGVDLTTDESSNLYVTGFFSLTADLDPSDEILNFTSAGEVDIFVLKLNIDGDLVWAKSIGGTGIDICWSISVDESENVYLGGFFTNTSDFDPGIDIFFMTSNGSFDAFVEKLNSDGSFAWVKQIGGLGSDEIYPIELDNEGNIYFGGSFELTADFQSGPEIYERTSNGSYDMFIQKLDNDGNFIWVKTMGGTGFDQIRGIKLRDDIIYISGYFSESVDFDPNDGVFNLTSQGSGDIFVEKLDLDGNFIWARAIGGSGPDYGIGLELASADDIYLYGRFDNIVDFNFGDEGFNLMSNGEGDIFILKLNDCFSTTTTDVFSACVSYTWIDGITYYHDNDSAMHILTNIAGCDSIVYLNLTISEVDITTTEEDDVFTANATDAIYQWIDCDADFEIIPGEINKEFTPIEFGNYAVIVTIGECSDTSDCIAFNDIGINDLDEISKINLYPNPTNGLVNIDLGKIQAYSIHVLSVNGLVIYSENDNLSGVFQVELDVAAGLYFVDVLTEQGNVRVKLVVE